MVTQTDLLWQAKLAAWIHDPAEKALVLLRDPAGHEQGTVRALRNELFPNGLSKEILEHVKMADQWAAAADRPQFPRRQGDGPYEQWAQVRFDKEPVLIHPLSGEEIRVSEGFEEIDPAHLKAVSTDHFRALIERDRDGVINHRKTALSLWRFGPDTPAEGLGGLWGLLPADTRIPDHSIWTHLDLTSALATAFCADSHSVPALLTVSFGPVQGFISQSRSSSDLWAGSHLLSRIAWEGMRVICESLGPDAIVFPQLRGIPMVDHWLLRDVELLEERFADLAWKNQKTDANPLFMAALPNRFVAIVPASMAEELAHAVARQARAWTLDAANHALAELLGPSGTRTSSGLYCHTQVKEQLDGFPEVYWAAVPWSLVSEESGAIDTAQLESGLRFFYPPTEANHGFLGGDAWKVLQQGYSLGDAVFYRPNRGVLYPAFYDLLDRLGAAAKSVRPFRQLPQSGYRCSLCGEREWLATEPDHLDIPPGERANTLWLQGGNKRASWNRKGEHLCALCSLKRLWPSLFVKDEIRELIPDVQRYVVSTHTMALCTSMERWLKTNDRKLPETWLEGQLLMKDTAALPRKLDRMLRDQDPQVSRFVRTLPVFLDEMRNALVEPGQDERRQAEECLARAEGELKQVLGHKPESYYAFLLVDGDKMGAWISGSDPKLTQPYRETWHPKIRDAVANSPSAQVLSSYLETPRAASPGRHMAISQALNAFSLHVVRYVVEDLYKGKLLYAGGDDALAMLCIDDLLSAMMTLRLCYSGFFPEGEAGDRTRTLLGLPDPNTLKIGKGHIWIRRGRSNSLLRMMGQKATISMGAVVAHHMAPLSRVLRVLRETERRAKEKGRRDAYAVTLLKRAGGAVDLTVPWFADAGSRQKICTTLEVMIEIRDALARQDLARRAPYLVQEWLRSMPSNEHFGQEASDGVGLEEMLAKTLAYQLKRQAKPAAAGAVASIAQRMAALSVAVQGRTHSNGVSDFITDFLSVAEFLARECRSGTN